MQQHIYTSSKGEDFLSCHEWATYNLSEEEYKFYIAEADSPEKTAIFARWMKEEQIISHTMVEDGKEIMVYDIK